MKPETTLERKQKNRKQDQLTKSVRYSMLQVNKAYPRLQNASFLNILMREDMSIEVTWRIYLDEIVRHKSSTEKNSSMMRCR